ncbi:acetoacetate--CoA ligase [Streptomyces tendae]|uniref:acetoacetate--CoA ligase n=1 Tax=Streptomyces tendae TaxID=1932 RepID=UPI0036B81594
MTVPAGDTPTPPVWTPDPQAAAASRMAAFARFAAERTGHRRTDYAELWQWSVTDLSEFWSAIWEFFRIESTSPYRRVHDDAPMGETRWFEGTRLNYAQHALRHGAKAGQDTALIDVAESGETRHITWRELRQQVGSLAAWLRGAGVRPGDRVVGYVPATSACVIAFLATAAVGAVWSACAQDYGAAGAATRFAQLEPVVLFTADGYDWNGERHDRRAEADSLRDSLPSVRHTVRVPNLNLPWPGAAGTTPWHQVVSDAREPEFEQLPFDAPLWVLFSSGTTGVPKGIVHGHGGVLVEHHKLLGLHLDLRAGEPYFWYTTTNWMMWNMVVSGLLLGATPVLYDGSPTHPAPQRLFDIAARHRVGVLGVSPGYLSASARAGLTPGRSLDLTALRVLGSTEAPLPARSYHWVREWVGPAVQVASTSGGTDVVSGFAGGSPTVPVWAGEISAPYLGVSLDAWDADGHPVLDEVGELVITRPMPSMPLYFWNDDPDNSRYHSAYFSTYPGVWRHGDWVTLTSRGSIVVSGRSDSTLNRHGVRLGSADIYTVVDRLPEVADSLVIGAELADGSYWMPLFVVMAPGRILTEDARSRIKEAIRTEASPRHVPDTVIGVEALPRTRTGKRLEVPVKRLLQGADLAEVADPEAVDDYAALAFFRTFARTCPEASDRTTAAPDGQHPRHPVHERHDS